MNDDLIQTSGKDRRPTLATAVLLSFALHIAGLGLWSLWPLKTMDRTPSPPPIKIKAVFEETAIEKKDAPAEAKHHDPSDKAAKTAPLEIAKAQNAAKHPLPVQAAPALAGPRRLSPEEMPAQATLETHHPARAAASPVARKPSTAPRVAGPPPTGAATPLARVATANKPPPSTQAEPRAEAQVESSAFPLPPADVVGMARRVSQPPKALPLAEAAPLAALSEGVFPLGQPSEAWKKIVHAPSSPLQPIAVESQPSSAFTVPPRTPVAAVSPGVTRNRTVLAGPLLPTAAPDHFSTLDLGALRDGYSSTVRSRIAKARYYPDKGRAAGHEGRPVVSFLLGGGGELLELSLIESSGHSTLDVAAIQAVERAAPFPEIPMPLKETSMRFNLPIAFRLESP